AIGYFKSVKMVGPSIIFALLRGIIFLIPAFILMPRLFGVTGIWLSLFVSEFLCSLSIVVYYLAHRRH
ncbi:MAG: MATE family efflux transporter, partial [Paramuribaculum sp.]|nr:MATE family efflux transporter [Paramuribaculum sp.]